MTKILAHDCFLELCHQIQVPGLFILSVSPYFMYYVTQYWYWYSSLHCKYKVIASYQQQAGHNPPPPSVGIVLKPMSARASPTGFPDPGRSVPKDDHRLVLVAGLRSYSLSNRNQETRKYLENENNWSLKSNRTEKGKRELCAQKMIIDSCSSRA